jgi:TatD DNase family protein
MRILAFDAHNHIHLGRSNVPLPTLFAGCTSSCISSSSGSGAEGSRLGGIAIMSTHPRDYPTVLELSRSIPCACLSLHDIEVKVVPCFGVHPWFLHELNNKDESDDDVVTTGIAHHTATTDNESDHHQTAAVSTPMWLQELEHWIKSTPEAIVGEIGMDGFHFDGTTGKLTTPMDDQIQAFEAQMEIAARLQRPVSIHAVQCFGPLMMSLSKLKKMKNKNPQTKLGTGLPPKMYFHAFGGKVGTIDQILALCGTKPGQVYFGFSPVVNFRSPKTASVIRKVGLNRLVLETDHEDASLVPQSIEEVISLIADALNVSRDEVVEQTTRNAFDLYGLHD